MTGLKNKSEQNLRASNILYKPENQCYASCVHCSYFSCLQYLAYIIKLKKLITGTFKQEQNKTGKGSHEIIKYLFEVYYIKNIDNKGYNEYKEWFQQLEQIRVESDYWEDDIEPVKAKISIDLSNRILNQVKGKIK